MRSAGGCGAGGRGQRWRALGCQAQGWRARGRKMECRRALGWVARGWRVERKRARGWRARGRRASRPAPDLWPHKDISSQAPCPRPQASLNGSAEWWPSGRRHTPAKGADGNVSRVRIPSTPPLAPAKAFSRSGCGRIFPLFSRVMRERLLTGSGARRLGSGLSGTTFSGPHDCGILVNGLQGTESSQFFDLPI